MRATALFGLSLIVANLWGVPASRRRNGAAGMDRQRQPPAAVVLKAQVLLDRARASPVQWWE